MLWVVVLLVGGHKIRVASDNLVEKSLKMQC